MLWIFVVRTKTKAQYPTSAICMIFVWLNVKPRTSETSKRSGFICTNSECISKQMPKNHMSYHAKKVVLLYYNEPCINPFVRIYFVIWPKKKIWPIFSQYVIAMCVFFVHLMVCRSYEILFLLRKMRKFECIWSQFIETKKKRFLFDCTKIWRPKNFVNTIFSCHGISTTFLNTISVDNNRGFRKKIMITSHA